MAVAVGRVEIDGVGIRRTETRRSLGEKTDCQTDQVSR